GSADIWRRSQASALPRDVLWPGYNQVGLTNKDIVLLPPGFWSHHLDCERGLDVLKNQHLNYCLLVISFHRVRKHAEHPNHEQLHTRNEVEGRQKDHGCWSFKIGQARLVCGL